MCRVYWTVVAVIGTALVCSGQSEFDAASVKVADPSLPPRVLAGGPGNGDPGHYSVRAVLLDILTAAYGVQYDLISGGPDWLKSDRYEIDAVMPPDTTQPRFQAMLQNLLAQRFHLSVHRETRNFPAFDLVVAEGGPKFQETAPTPEPPSLGAAAVSGPRTDRDGFPVLPPGPHTGRILSKGNLRFKFQERSMAYFAGVLGSLIQHAAGPDFGAKVPRVFDKTGLPGKYDFTLEFACADCVAASAAATPPVSAGGPVAGSDGPGIFQAIEKHLGLKAVRVRDVPLEVIVVDRVDRSPTPN